MQKLNFAPAVNFCKGDLMTTLSRHITGEFNGYLKLKLVHHQADCGVPEAYIAIAEGKVVFAANKPFSWQALQSQFLRYIPRLRSPSYTESWKLADTDVESGIPIPTVLDRLISIEGILTHNEVTEVIGVACLDLLDSYRSLEGKVTVQEDMEVAECKPIDGLSLQNLQEKVVTRWSQWNELSHIIPSTQHVIWGNQEKIEALNITENQRKHILSITQHQRSIDQLAEEAGCDILKIAQILEPLLKVGVAILKPDSPNHASIQDADESKQKSDQYFPEKLDEVDVFVVDDSPMMLKQFKALVSSWSYSVRTCSRASQAVEQLLACHPGIIFVDINMPEMSGFQLLREIRLQPELSEIPVVILTAEESYSNIQKARGSRCEFLAKPINTQDIDSFGWDLLEILSNCESLAVA